MDLSTIRSLLFVPATKLDKIDLIKASGADLIIIDLEDSVAPDQKDDMRQAVTQFFENRSSDDETLIGVRINSVRLIDGLIDFLSIIDTEVLPDAIMLPKVTSPEELDIVGDWMEDLNVMIPLIPIIETLQVWDMLEHVMAHELVPCAVFGGIDLAAELGCERSWEPLYVYRSEMLRAARSAGKGCIDMPWFDLNDEAGLKSETVRMRAMGYDGRAAIHPKQVAIIHDCFKPGDAEIADAKEMIKAFESAQTGVATFKGKVVEKPVLLQALKLIDRMERY